MQNLKINGTPTPYWCVVVPVTTIIQGIDKSDVQQSIEYIVNNDEDFELLPPGDFYIIGCITSSSMNEGVKEMVEGIEEYKGIWIWKDYVNGKALHTAHESALSLLTHNQITLTTETKAVVVKQK